MNVKCKCGGTHQRDGHTKTEIIWKCPACLHIIVQRKRTPYKINAERDMRKIRLHIEELLERNPISDKNRGEWDKFLHEYITLWTELDKIIHKTSITLKENNDNISDQ